MKERKLTLADLEKAVGGKLDSDITDHLNEVIHLAKKADKTMEQCIQDFYCYNKDFTPEHEAYIRSRWDQVK
jgi:hypothetical protein